MSGKNDGEPRKPKEPQAYIAFQCPVSLAYRFDKITGQLTQRGARAKVLRHLMKRYAEEQEALARVPHERVGL